MAFALVRYAAGAAPTSGTWGLVRGDTLVPLPGTFSTTAEVLAEGVPVARSLLDDSERGGAPLPLRDVQVLSPVTAPCQIVAQGANYRSHLREVGLDPRSPHLQHALPEGGGVHHRPVRRHRAAAARTAARLRGRARPRARRPDHRPVTVEARRSTAGSARSSSPTTSARATSSSRRRSSTRARATAPSARSARTWWCRRPATWRACPSCASPSA